MIADHFSEIGRKKFIARQRILLQEAHLVSGMVKEQLACVGSEGVEP